MNHPEIFLIPVLMLADYYLTILSARSKKSSGHDQHYAVRHFELNPVFQKDVAATRWFSPRHLAFVVLFTAILLFFDFLASNPTTADVGSWMLPGMFGFLASMFLIVIGRHFMNLALFRSMRLHPENTTGKVEIAHGHMLRVSRLQTIQVILPLAFVAIMAPSPLTIGAAPGPVRLFAAHFQWEAKYRRQEVKAAAGAPPVIGESPAQGPPLE